MISYCESSSQIQKISISKQACPAFYVGINMSGIFEIKVCHNFWGTYCEGCNTDRAPSFRGETADKMLFLKCSCCGADLYIDLKKYDLEFVKKEIPLVADGYKILEQIKRAEADAWALMRKVKVALEKVDDLNKSLTCIHSFNQSMAGSSYVCQKCGWVDK